MTLDRFRRAAALILGCFVSLAWAADPVVTTDAGQVRGAFDKGKGIYAFKGIHYGENTAGANRFRPPIPVVAWSGVRDATMFGDVCPQLGTAGRRARMHDGSEGDLPMSEDCLVLNVWTPALEGRRPVMVWLHGRGFSAGAGSEPAYDGTNLAKRGDVVVVTINHRLGAFGYLYLAKVAGREYEASGLVGMLDAELALRWVKGNIARFGGDASNVTIFGESGGGAKVSAMLAMPSARELFRRGIIESGPGLRGAAPQTAARAAQAFMEKLGVETVVALEQVPMEELLGALEGEQREAMRFAPVVDGEYLPVHPFDPVAAPSAVGKQVLIGTNRDEALYFNRAHPKRDTMTLADLEEDLETRIGAGWQEVLNTYRFSRPHATPWELFIAISSEGVRRRSITLAERAASAGNRVYMYLFEFEANERLKAAHGMEIRYAFANATAIDPRPEAAEVERDMSGAWVAFARDGDPNHEGLPPWPLYDARTRATMIFDTPSRVVNDPRRAERIVWEGVKEPEML